MVTHHVEEIMPVFSHALLLREERVTASGPKHGVLTSAQLSTVFGAQTRLQSAAGRYSLQIVSQSVRVL